MKKAAIIGCGGIGGYHLGILSKFKDIELAGFCDLLIDRARAFVKKAKTGKAYSCFYKMFDEIQPDMVFICIPPSCHGEIEYETIRRGIPFFVEKPLALDPVLARDIIKKVEEKGLIAASGFQGRYDSINETAKKFIKENQVLHISASRIGGMVDTPWFRYHYLSGGQLVEQTIHQMDMLRYLLEEEPDTVYSVAKRGIITHEEWQGFCIDDMSTTLVTFKSGITLTMVTGVYSLGVSSWDNKMTFGTRTSRMDYRLITDVTIYDESTASTENLGGLVSGDGMQRTGDGEVGIREKSVNDCGYECDRTFVDAVISGDGSKIRSSYADAWKSVAFCLACNKSMELGLPIKVEY